MLAPAPGSLQIDATVGGGGHTERILEASDPDGRLLGLDADGAAIARVGQRLARFGDRLVLRQANFRDLGTVAPAAGFGRSTACSSTWACRASSSPTATAASGSGPADRSTCASTRAAASRPPSCSRPSTRTSSPRSSGATARSRTPGGSPGRSSTTGARRRSRPPRPWPALIERIVPPDPRKRQPDPSGDARLPGAAHRRQRRARRPRGGPGGLDGPAAARRPPRRPQLPLARGPDRQTLHRGRTAGLHLPARAVPVCVCGRNPRLRPLGPSLTAAARGGRRQPPLPERPAPGRRTDRRLSRP